MTHPKPALTVYVADDCPHVRALTRIWLDALGCKTECFPDGLALCEALQRNAPNLVFLDLMMPKMSGMQVLQWMKSRRLTVPVVVFSAVDDVKTVVQAVQLGAHDYETKPLSQHRIETIVRLSVESRVTLIPPSKTNGLVGSAPAMQPVFEAIAKSAKSQISVLISGESGTGKELIARAIHQNSRRARGPFVAINCGAIPEGLQESELFGHERGAFTGAIATHRGYFEQANTGTIFLDEVSELSASAQRRLLRVLQERQVQRVGGTKVIDLDIRIIAATNRALHLEASRGSFRRDLYYRLAVFPIEVPPLRARPEDILPLVAHFAAKHGERDELPMTDDVRQVLEGHSWPGNVRELENVVQYALVDGGDLLTVDGLPPLLDTDACWDADESTHIRVSKRATHDLRSIERDTITTALRTTGGNVSEAAKLVGMSRATLYRKLARYRDDDSSEESA